MGTGVIEFGDDDDDEQNEPCCSAASSAVFPSIHPQNRPKKPPKMSVKKEVLELERMERPKRRSVVLAEKLIAKCNEEVQFLYDSKADPSFRCSSAARFRKPKKEEADPDFREGLEPVRPYVPVKGSSLMLGQKMIIKQNSCQKLELN